MKEHSIGIHKKMSDPMARIIVTVRITSSPGYNAPMDIAFNDDFGQTSL